MLQINAHGDYTGNPILDVIQNETDVARLRGHLQIDGEIILWSSFWVTLSSLMSGGKTLDELISIPSGDLPSENGGAAGSSSCTALVPLGETSSGNNAANLGPYFNSSSNGVSGEKYDPFASQGGRARSDSEIARQMQAEIDGELLLESTGQMRSGPSMPVATSTSSASSIRYAGGAGHGVAGVGVGGGSGNINDTISALNFSSLASGFANSFIPASSSSVAASSSSSAAVPSAPAFAPSAAAASSSAAGETAAPMREDSEVARALQAEWDAEDAAAAGGGINNVNFHNPFDTEFPPGTTRTKHSSSMDVNTDTADADFFAYDDDVPDLVPMNGAAGGSYTTPTKKHISGDYNSKMPANSDSWTNR